MGTSLDVSRKECQGEQREQTQFSSSLDEWYQRRGHRMSHTGSGVVVLVLDGSRFCVSRTKNGKEKCECESKWRGRREVGV
jgi:hypothetical protein